jgi:hypothetical protein
LFRILFLIYYEIPVLYIYIYIYIYIYKGNITRKQEARYKKKKLPAPIFTIEAVNASQRKHKTHHPSTVKRSLLFSIPTPKLPQEPELSKKGKQILPAPRQRPKRENLQAAGVIDMFSQLKI